MTAFFAVSHIVKTILGCFCNLVPYLLDVLVIIFFLAIDYSAICPPMYESFMSMLTGLLELQDKFESDPGVVALLLSHF